MTQTTEISIPKGAPEVSMTRTFDAPRGLVFRLFTDPALIPRWWGPRDLETSVDRMEARAGGTWRFLHRDSTGNTYGFHGVFHDVVAPERVVQTFEFEGEPGHVQLQTATFEPAGAKTRLTMQAVFQSLADRNGMVESGMERGAIDMMDRLAELLREQTVRAR